MSSTTASVLVGTTHPNDGVINPDVLIQVLEGSGIALSVHSLGNESALPTIWVLSDPDQLVVALLAAISMTLPENAKHSLQKKDRIDITEKNFKEMEQLALMALRQPGIAITATISDSASLRKEELIALIDWDVQVYQETYRRQRSNWLEGIDEASYERTVSNLSTVNEFTDDAQTVVTELREFFKGEK